MAGDFRSHYFLTTGGVRDTNCTTL